VSELERSWRQEGHFWPPGSDAKSAGWIDYRPDRGVAVHLLESPLPAAPMDEYHLDVLYGESLDGWPWSLFDGELVGPSTITPGDARSADIVFDTLVRGGHLDGPADVVGTIARVAIHGLRELLRGGGFGPALLSVTADEECNDQLIVEMPWGSLRLLAAGTQTKWSRDETRVAVRAHVQMHFDQPLALPDVEALVEPLRDLVIFARTRPSHVTGLALLGEAQPGLRTREFTVIRRPDSDPKDADTRGPPLIFNPALVPDPHALLRSWFGLRERLGPVWRLFFATTVDPWLTRESQLLNLTAFAEGYHRALHDEPPLPEHNATTAVEAMLATLADERTRKVFRGALDYANSQSQRVRVRWLARRAASALPDWHLDVARLTTQVADTRNWLTHWGERGEHVCEGDELELLIARLHLVLVANVLLDLGLDEGNVIEQMGMRMQLLGELR
jgi:hypothetical protein